MRPAPNSDIAGIVLAAGAGSRLGAPKGLLRTAAGQPVVAALCGQLTAAGLAEIVVVTGAAAEAVAAGVPAGARATHAPDWQDGLSASLRAGLQALAAVADGAEADVPAGEEAEAPAAERIRAAVILLADVPDITAEAIAAVIDAARESGVETSLVRAVFGARPGHPVVIGAAHWPQVIATATGDAGAKALFASGAVREVDCSHLCTGADVDTPEQLQAAGLRLPDDVGTGYAAEVGR